MDTLRSQFEEAKLPQQEDQGEEYVGKLYRCCGFIVIVFEVLAWTQVVWAGLIEYIPYYFGYNMIYQIVISMAFFVLVVLNIRALVLGYRYNSEAVRHPELVLKLCELEQMRQDKWCMQCKIKRSKDIHHCSMCNRCHIRMDHHCYFFGTCVGEFNYRFFFTYLFLTMILGIIMICMLHPQMELLISFKFKKIQGKIWRLIVLYLCSWIFSVLLCSCMIISHLFLILNDIRQLEYKYNMKSVKYPFTRLLKRLVCIKDGQSAIPKDFSNSWMNIQQSSSFWRLFFPKYSSYSYEQFLDYSRQKMSENLPTYVEPNGHQKNQISYLPDQITLDMEFPEDSKSKESNRQLHPQVNTTEGEESIHFEQIKTPQTTSHSIQIMTLQSGKSSDSQIQREKNMPDINSFVNTEPDQDEEQKSQESDEDKS